MSGTLLAFIPKPYIVRLDDLLPSKAVPAGLLTSVKYLQIRSSIVEVGLIEPLSISAAQPDGRHVVLDGHVRLAALRELGHAEVLCLVSTDDESYTCNTKINRLPTIAEHKMLLHAVQQGVSEERLARALNVDITQIEKKVRLLHGICPEAAELLNERQFSAEIVRVLRKMKETRQVECVELMVSANSLKVTYAEALLAATPVGQLVDGQKPKKLAGLTAGEIQKMEREMANLQGQYKLIEQGYAEDVLNLVLARGYVAKLLENEAVARFIRLQKPELAEPLQHLVDVTSLEQ
ncbi:plasmid partitioning protein RepB C-terminal domain-containing protein [Silvimonas iriomotensis]|uniref:Chromosome partitioning protein ParB n=1 Tax=Silvimonas iriomotensis TaxID=449662 RepID=A0ABQ2PE14_9NEIS|nr:plasmid partitioning protein RepB C-terminal domain-containing protein [Silvimonas iriomotensis]GGP23794.1 chromosome partitioning protein ParB [Silvimonas iriomotensis]